MPLISTQIEIASPPERVRDVFLDWDKLSQWSHFFALIEPPVGKNKNTIEKGDKLKVAIGSTTFSPSVLENTSHEFKWSGALPFLFVGDHSFRFEPSKTSPGSTTFVNEEIFSGALGFLMGELGGYGFGPKTKANFEGFNRDLKERVESLYGAAGQLGNDTQM